MISSDEHGFVCFWDSKVGVSLLCLKTADNRHQKWECLKQLQLCQSLIKSMIAKGGTLWIASVDATLWSISLKVSLFATR